MDSLKFLQWYRESNVLMLTYVVMTLPETFHPFLMETGQKHAEEWRFFPKRSQEEEEKSQEDVGRMKKMEEISREDGGTLLLSLEFMDWHLQWENGF